jgi:hypothetical protein
MSLSILSGTFPSLIISEQYFWIPLSGLIVALISIPVLSLFVFSEIRRLFVQALFELIIFGANSFKNSASFSISYVKLST